MLQPSSSAAQRRIYQAALRLFGEKGIQHVSVKELAEQAGVARGTIYNHVDSIEALFEDVAQTLSAEMNQRLMLSFRDIADPDLRLSIGIRLYIKRAHEDPEWGLFISRSGFHSSALRQLGASHPIKILMDGIQSKRYNLNIDQLSSCVAMLTSFIESINLVAASLPPLIPKVRTPQVPSGIYLSARALYLLPSSAG